MILPLPLFTNASIKCFRFFMGILIISKSIIYDFATKQIRRKTNHNCIYLTYLPGCGSTAGGASAMSTAGEIAVKTSE